MPGAADNEVMAVGQRCGDRDHQPILGDLAPIAEDHVVAATAENQIRAAVAPDDVVRISAVDLVVARAALDPAGPGAQPDQIVTRAAFHLEGHVDVGHAGQIDDVVAFAAQGDDPRTDVVGLRHPLADAQTGRPYLDLARPRRCDVELLGDILLVALQSLLSELAHIQLQHAAGQLAGQRWNPRERDVEIDQRDLRRDVPFLVDREQQQIDFQVREQLGIQPPVHVEYRQRRQDRAAVTGFVQEVRGQFVQADFAVFVRIVQVEIDLGENPAAHARFGRHQVDLGRRRDAAVQLDFGHVDRPRRVHVVDEKPVEQQQRVAETRIVEIEQALRVVAEGKVDLRAQPTFDRCAQRTPDREKLGIAEFEYQRIRVDPH